MFHIEYRRCEEKRPRKWKIVLKESDDKENENRHEIINEMWRVGGNDFKAAWNVKITGKNNIMGQHNLISF